VNRKGASIPKLAFRVISQRKAPGWDYGEHYVLAPFRVLVNFAHHRDYSEIRWRRLESGSSKVKIRAL
jgi:hypothetical protein